MSELENGLSETKIGKQEMPIHSGKLEKSIVRLSCSSRWRRSKSKYQGLAHTRRKKTVSNP